MALGKPLIRNTGKPCPRCYTPMRAKGKLFKCAKHGLFDAKGRRRPAGSADDD